MEVEAMTLETRGLWLDEGKPDQGYGRHFHFDEIGVSKRSGAMGEMAFERPVPEKAAAGRSIVKAASWSDLVADFAYRPDAAWTAPAEEFAAGNKAARAEVFSAGNKAARAEVYSAGNKAAPAEVFSAGNKAAQAEEVFSVGDKAAQAEEVFSAGNKAAQAEVFAAGNKAAQVKGREEAKSAGAVKKTKKKVVVKVSDEHIKILLANPPDPTFSQRIRSLNQESGAFAAFEPEERQEILDLLPEYADMVDKRNDAELEILRQYEKYGSAYEEIEVDEEIEADEGN